MLQVSPKRWERILSKIEVQGYPKAYLGIAALEGVSTYLWPVEYDRPWYWLGHVRRPRIRTEMGQIPVAHFLYSKLITPIPDGATLALFVEDLHDINPLHHYIRGSGYLKPLRQEDYREEVPPPPDPSMYILGENGHLTEDELHEMADEVLKKTRIATLDELVGRYSDMLMDINEEDVKKLFELVRME